MTEQGYAFMVMDVPNSSTKGLGRHRFRVPPRQGEYITLNDEEGIGQAYEVVAVLHPLDLAGAAGDLFVRYVSTDLELRTSLKQP